MFFYKRANDRELINYERIEIKQKSTFLKRIGLIFVNNL
jgi:hypothetical protein